MKNILIALLLSVCAVQASWPVPDGSTIVIEGDSNFERGEPAGQRFSDVLMAQPVWDKSTAIVTAWAGKDIEGCILEYPTRVFPHRPAEGTTAYLVLNGTANNFRSYTPGHASDAKAVFELWSSYVARARADGFTVIACTTAPTCDTATSYYVWSVDVDKRERERQAFNRRVRLSQSWNYIADLELLFGSQPFETYDFNLWDGGNQTNYFFLHWGLGGKQRVANAICAAVISGAPALNLGSAAFQDARRFSHLGTQRLRVYYEGESAELSREVVSVKFAYASPDFGIIPARSSVRSFCGHFVGILCANHLGGGMFTLAPDTRGTYYEPPDAVVFRVIPRPENQSYFEIIAVNPTDAPLVVGTIKFIVKGEWLAP